ncbi:MAG TPA: thioredoxin domain-containing protein [Bacteroidota bacterium]|nr:thioredoxin domain-containing protein [Bacteroidota bacterium]
MDHTKAKLPGIGANRLIHEKSPYLLQHAHNPVDWFPWGQEAFHKARSEDKPLFLSVGYSTCHWCHVMERESFENTTIAEILNERFVPVKVDREERPDIDRIYMTALQAMGESGGWPMTMFLTPALKPFYGGTYFPPMQKYGRIGLVELLQRISDVWRMERSKVEESAGNLALFLQDVSGAVRGDALPGKSALDQCYEQLRSTFDSVQGGFGHSAKFPRPVVLEFLLRYYSRTGVPAALTMVEKTLDAMADGGIFDHLGGGFHRYAVDPEWRVPHFEKMLYDQAQLIDVFLSGYLVTRKSLFAEAVRSTADYLLRDMRDSQGAFYSAEDADSLTSSDSDEKGEGAFYLWTKKEILEILGEHDGGILSLRYGVDDEGNATVDPQGEFAGKNILHISEDVETLSKIAGLSEEELKALLSRGKETLHVQRSKRPRPFRDEKILSAWNGLVIGALARAGSVLKSTSYVDAAKAVADFVLQSLRDKSSGRLLRRFRDGLAGLDGHLADYSFVVHGLLELYSATGESRWLSPARELTETMIELLHDKEHGGFFETALGDPTVIARLKEHYDGAEPSGNSIAVLNLLRLAALLDRPEWRTIAEKTLAAFSPLLAQQPVAMPNMMSALDQCLGPASEIVLVGPRNDSTTMALEKEVRMRYLPRAVIVPVYPGKQAELRDLAGLIRGLPLDSGRPAAYVCENFACNLPVTRPSDLAAILDQPKVN